MLSIDVLNYDCLIHVFMFLDVENLTNMVTVNENLYLAAAKIVFKRKFQNEFTILDSSCERTTSNYISRLKYFGDLITKLHISLPLPQLQRILEAVNVNCKESLIEFGFHYFNENFSNDDLNTMGHFIRHLDSFVHLRALECKYGDLHTNYGKFDSLQICIPEIPSLKEMTIDGFGGLLDQNTKKSIESNPQIQELTLSTRFETLHSSYLSYIASKLTQLKSLDLRFAVFFPLDGSSTPLNFNFLEKLKVVCYFNLPENILPFSGDLMYKLEQLDYICATTNDQVIHIVSHLKQLKKLKIGACGLDDNHLIILAKNLEKIELLHIADLPSNQATQFLFTSEGIRRFLNERKELAYLFISMNQGNTNVNHELVVNIKQALRDTDWTVLLQNFTEIRYIVICKC